MPNEPDSLERKIRVYKDRIRIFLILYFFSDDYFDENNADYVKMFNSEVKIQKIDFLLRNPDYLSFELINFVKENKADKDAVKLIIKSIFDSDEPDIRRIEMEKFFFGAYEDIDDVISFLKSINFIDHECHRAIDLRKRDNVYYITRYAQEKISTLENLESVKWYVDRCAIIKNFFGDLSGTELKAMQYKINEYKDTAMRQYIETIQNKVRESYFELYGVML